MSTRALTEYEPVLAYIGAYWPRLVRRNPQSEGTLIGLPHPYVVPSDGAMFAEMYYWDSYFMALGLVGTPQEDLIVGMAENLASLFRRFGIIPNASRYHFLSRSQPPFFTALIWLAFDVKRRRGDADAEAYLSDLMEVAEGEQETVWLGVAQPNFRQVFEGLSRYFDTNFLDMLASCESGWDHSTRCDDRWLQFLPVDLNSILYARERDFARAAELLGRAEKAQRWTDRAAERAATMERLMWDEGSGFFLDFDWVARTCDPNPSLAGFYPLWAGLATPKQAERLAQEWLPRFEFPGGLVATLRAQPGRQWAYPNGWAPLQWIVTEGLDSYGYQEDAQRIRRKWCDNCARVFSATGSMWEKYNVADTHSAPEGGLYGSVSGFGWSNAVFADFARKLSSEGLATR